MGGLPPLNFYKLIDRTSFSKRAIASRVFSWVEKAVRRKNFSPLFPKPAPGVPTT